MAQALTTHRGSYLMTIQEIALAQATAFADALRAMMLLNDIRIPWTDYGFKQHTIVLYNFRPPKVYDKSN